MNTLAYMCINNASSSLVFGSGPNRITLKPMLGKELKEVKVAFI